MKNTIETRLGIFFAVILIAAVFLLEMVGGPEFFKRGIRLKATFNNVQDLKLGDPVKMAGVQIGRVEDISILTNRVLVTMKVDRNKALTTSRATIKFLGLMGQNYMSLDFGATTNADGTLTYGHPAEDNFMLPSIEQADLSALISKLDSVAGGIDGLTKGLSSDIANLTGPFTDFMKNNKDRISLMLGNMQTISSKIAKGEGTIGRLVNDDALYLTALSTVTNLNDAASDAKQVVNQAKGIVKEIGQGQGTIGKLVMDEKLYQEVAAAATSLKEILEKVNKGQGTAGRLVNDESLYKNVKLTLQKLDKATEGLEDQGALSVISMAVGSLF